MSWVPSLKRRLMRPGWLHLWLLGLAVLPCLWIWADPWMGAVQEAMQGSPTASFIAALVGPFGKTGTQLMVLALCFALAWVFWGRRRATTWLTLTMLCLLSTGLVVTVTKVSVRRVRPAFVADPIATERGVRGITTGRSLSFPSGDAASVFAIAMAALPFVPRGALVVFVLGAMVGASRFYGGAHHFSDVWGSLLIATAVCAWVLQRWRRREASRPPDPDDAELP
jgi:membrane-associated phospholipid phosphatase